MNSAVRTKEFKLKDRVALFKKSARAITSTKDEQDHEERQKKRDLKK